MNSLSFCNMLEIRQGCNQFVSLLSKSLSPMPNYLSRARRKNFEKPKTTDAFFRHIKTCAIIYCPSRDVRVADFCFADYSRPHSYNQKTCKSICNKILSPVLSTPSVCLSFYCAVFLPSHVKPTGRLLCSARLIAHINSSFASLEGWHYL